MVVLGLGEPEIVGAEGGGDVDGCVTVVGAKIVVMRGVVGVNCGAASTVHPGVPVTLGLHAVPGEPASDTRTEM